MKRRRQICAACPRVIERWMRLCGPCWKRLPADQRRAIVAALQLRDVLSVSRLTHDAVAWLAAHAPAVIAARQLGEPLDFARDERDPP
jgi:hypothetical protein